MAARSAGLPLSAEGGFYFRRLGPSTPAHQSPSVPQASFGSPPIRNLRGAAPGTTLGPCAESGVERDPEPEIREALLGAFVGSGGRRVEPWDLPLRRGPVVSDALVVSGPRHARRYAAPRTRQDARREPWWKAPRWRGSGVGSRLHRSRPDARSGDARPSVHALPAGTAARVGRDRRESLDRTARHSLRGAAAVRLGCPRNPVEGGGRDACALRDNNNNFLGGLEQMQFGTFEGRSRKR